MRRLVAAIMFTMSVSAQELCLPTPEPYRHMEFGDVRFAIEEDCAHQFTQNDELFLAGITQALWTRCKLPRTHDRRRLIEPLLKSANLAMDHPDHANAIASGTSMMNDIPCGGPEAALLVRGIAIHLEHTANQSRFVRGCAEFYAGQYDTTQCRCIAEKLGTVSPDIDQRFFDKKLIKQGIHESPIIALSLMLSCGIDKY
jgi:hypothetical protein